MRAMLILAAVTDLALAALLVGTSGFVFGGGPEGMNGETGPAIVWAAALVASLAAPIAGFVLLRRNHPGLGAAVGWAPPLAAAIFFVVPFNPY